MKRWDKEWEERGAETLCCTLEYNPLGPATVKCRLYAEHRGDQTRERKQWEEVLCWSLLSKDPKGMGLGLSSPGFSQLSCSAQI